MTSDRTQEANGEILIVDDNITNLRILNNFLDEAGFKVLIAQDGENAIRIGEYAQPDLILLDVMMPGIDGFDTCAQLKANPLTREIPVIFMTALSDMVDKIKGLNLGAVDYITKPFHQEEVLAHVKVHLKLRNLTKLLQEQNSLLQQEIQERKQAQEALQESERKYRVLVETSQDIIFSCDAQGCFTFINQAVKNIHGYEPEEMIGRSFTDFVPLAQLPQDWEVFKRILAGESFLQYESVHKGKDGRRINLLFNAIVLRDAQGNVLGITGTASDITERKRAELALRESEERYRRIIETSYEGVWMIDAEGNTSFVNTRMAQMLGYTVEEMLGKHLFEFMDEEGVAIATADIERHRQGIAENHDFKFRRRNGSNLWAIVSTTSILDAIGQYAGSLAMVTDISDRKQAEAALQQAKEAADAASRAKGEFLSKMSHELRTPLNAILGFSQILNRDSSLTSQQQEYLGIINRAGEHLLTLINDVLEMSKIEAGRIELHETTFDLYHLLHSLEEMFQFKAESQGLQLTFNIAQSLPQYIRTDESKLRQVLINLLSNAIKFTARGSVTLKVIDAKTTFQRGSEVQGTLNRELLTESKDRQFTYFPLPTAHSLIFQVEDTGPGIAPEELTTLFDPFVQTETGKKSQSGTGLGLPISRQFVQLMGGEITVSSTLNRGSLFQFNIRFSVPEVTDIPTPKSTQKAIALQPNQPTYRLLVVEDRLESRFLLVRLLSQVGFEVREAVNGQEAVTLTESWQPHLIWMDIQMPVMDGYEATRQIRARERQNSKENQLSTTPMIIIALTANAFAEDKAAVLSAECDDFVTKPFREEVIFEKIAHYLGVRYIYEPTDLPSAEKLKVEATSVQFTPESFLGISPEYKAQLHQAASALEHELIGQLCEQITDSHPQLAKTLLDLTKKSRFDKIVEVLEQLPNDERSHFPIETRFNG